MSKMQETAMEALCRATEVLEKNTIERVTAYTSKYSKIKRGAVLSHIAALPEIRGLKAHFIDKDPKSLKQNFYVACKLHMASLREAEPVYDPFSTYTPFLYGLLSDSPEIHDWLTHAALKDREYVKGPHFRWHQFQLVLRRDDEALRETIVQVAKKGGKHDKALSRAGQDFFSLLLKQDKDGLEALIEDQAKIKSVNELEGQFLAGFAVIHAKLCWIRGIEVQIQNPLVPMALMPIEPLETYDVEYEFLRPGWEPPPPPGLLNKIRRLFL
ncbi:immunity 49 family protein [Aquincola tertiaricarbonis]|uniref:Immunity 49 family protein n=1 Tax=Aquincola tertiaricarbonis TaxID=391953 RepID=A0ABY4S385_AQUTE|nr:Imm49 family immunity protein [Aquincola tertiaricarbonis]URI07453.1 immunity 49 family protein [Aquincola tertiaricarbonis]